MVNASLISRLSHAVDQSSSGAGDLPWKVVTVRRGLKRIGMRRRSPLRGPSRGSGRERRDFSFFRRGVTRYGDCRPAEFQKVDRIGPIVQASTVHKRPDIRTVSIAGALKTMTKSPLKLVAPETVNRTVTMPRREAERRIQDPRAPTGTEVDRLIDAAKANRWGHRDATMILVAFRHGLRSSELVDLRWDQIATETSGKPRHRTGGHAPQAMVAA